MNILLDSFAWIELFSGSARGRKVVDLINKENKIYTTVLNLYEVYYKTLERYSESKADEYNNYIKENAEIISIDKEIVKEAAKLKIKTKLPAIDALVYAAAKKTDAKVVSGCPHFKKISNAYQI